MKKPHVSRKPIYKSNVRLRAYALVSQPREHRGPLPTAGELDTLRDDLGTFTEDRLDQIVGDHQAFVSVSREAVIAGHCLSLSKRRVVLEVLDDIVSDTAFTDALLELSRMGFKIAVGSTMLESLNGNGRSIADIVRINVLDLNDDELAKQVDRLSRPNIQLLADHVDTYKQFELCQQHNFDMYRGNFFCTPNGEATIISVSRLGALRVLANLQNPDVSSNELEATISADVTLSYKLLRFANSAFMGLDRPMKSINHAVKMVGIERIRVWASLLMFCKMEDKPPELMTTAIVRAAMCERMASSADEGPRETFFTVGLLSVLDALMDCPMEEALGDIPVSSEIKSALIRSEGSLGDALQCVLAYERGEWDQVRYKDLPPMTIRSHYLDSLGWARRISEGLNM